MMPPLFNANAKLVMDKRYLMRDHRGRVAETPAGMLERVARHVASGDQLFGEDKKAVAETEAQFLHMLSNLWFLPNSPTLMNAGNRLGQLAACFVLPVNDSMESIFNAVKNSAMIHKSGGGTGFAFSSIRPANDKVSSTTGVSSGPLSFINVFDVATEAVKQGGTRRGANMGILRVDHPDIEAFIKAKQDVNRLNNFNLSVAVTNSFLDALDHDDDYHLINPRNGEVVRRMPARRIFDLITESAWRTGEPGIIFLDPINADNPTPDLGSLEATNPCGEQPLLPYESCTLGSLNLARMANSRGIMFNRLKRIVHKAVHFLDNVIEVNQYPLAQIKKMSKATRKIGLGIMGFADMLIRLNTPYDSEEAVELANSIMAFIQKEARLASAELGRRRGNFPAYSQSRFNRPDTPHMRNATVTTIAPTGSISLLAGVSSGIEPLFALAHSRQVLKNKRLTEVHPLFIKHAKDNGYYTPELKRKVGKNGTLHDISKLPESARRIFRTALDITPRWHVRLQAAFQAHTDNAVSKTVNFPSHATQQDVAEAFLEAAASGCKGITIYRYGSRRAQVLQLGSAPLADAEQIAPRPRPQRTSGVTERISTGCGKLYVTINEDEQGICEVFAQMGKTGGCASSQIEASGRLISLALRSGVNVEAIIKQMAGIRCPSPAWQNSRMVLSCPDAMAQVLQRVAINNLETGQHEQANGMCPDCGESLVHEEGCLNCHQCGFSKCS